MAAKKKVSEEVVGYQPPKGATLGDVIDELAKRYQKRVSADAMAATFKREEDAVREYLLNAASEQDISGVRGKRSGASIAIIITDVPQLESWQDFFTFAKKKGNDDLLQASVSTPAWRERLKAGVVVPGIKVWQRVTLRFNPAKSK